MPGAFFEQSCPKLLNRARKLSGPTSPTATAQVDRDNQQRGADYGEPGRAKHVGARRSVSSSVAITVPGSRPLPRLARGYGRLCDVVHKRPCPRSDPSGADDPVALDRGNRGAMWREPLTGNTGEDLEPHKLVHETTTDS